jgi:molybdate transport system substrate-binding protein
MRTIAKAALAASSILFALPAAAAELAVYAAGAVKAVVSELAPEFEAASGHRLRFAFGTVGALRDRVLAGEAADVVVLSEAGLEALARQGKAQREDAAPLGAIEVGLAVRKGAPAPDISSEAALRAALLAAASIGWADPARGATAGTHFARVLDRLGLAETVKAKSVVLPFGIEVIDKVAAGEIALGVSQSSEIATNPGVTLAGTLPAPFALRTVYTAAVTGGGEPTRVAAARSYARVLASEGAARVFRRAGFGPAS